MYKYLELCLGFKHHLLAYSLHEVRISEMHIFDVFIDVMSMQII